MGTIAILAFVILGSAQDVFLGRFFAIYDPILVALYTFSVATLLLQSDFLFNSYNTFKDVWKNRTSLVALNIVTALNWISFFLALKYIEPAIVGSIAFSIGPLLNSLYLKFINKNIQKISLIFWISSIGTFISCIFLSLVTISGHSAIKTFVENKNALGIGLSLIAGIGMTTNSYISKSISKSELSSKTITSFRFIFIVLITGIYSFFYNSGDITKSKYFIISVLCLSIVGIVIPMTLIQFGIKKTDPKIASVFLSMTPALTLLLQALDKRLSFSIQSAIGVTLNCIFITIGLFDKNSDK